MAYTQISLAELLLQLATKVEGVPYWTPEEGRLAINESLRVWSMLTGVWKQRISITTTTSSWISAPAPLYYNVRMQYSGAPLGRSSIGDMDNGNPGWEIDSTTSGGIVPTTPKMFAPAGLDLFAIWPADGVGGNTLTVDGVVEAPTLIAAGDFIDINNASIQPILGYALHYLAFKEGGVRWAATQAYYKEFLLAAVDQNDRLATSALFRKAMGLDVNRGQRPMRTGLAEQQKAQG
jgi:hypothetical protein